MSIVVRNLSEQLVSLVRDRIIAGEVPPNVAVRQAALATELGVSAVPLREALARLEEEGLLVNQANRGFFVRPLSRSEAEDVYALRLKLEPEATASAARMATDADQARAVDTHATLSSVTREDGEGVGAFNRAFHLALIRPCRQYVTISFLERLQILSDRYVRKHLEPLGRNHRANQEHQELLNVWMLRDADRVEALTRAHIQQTLEDLRQQLPPDDIAAADLAAPLP
jgi:DNA-binding GntR family transcriptional regulator